MRIVLLMENQMMRDGLRALLRREPERNVVGEGGEGPETVELVQQLHPDLVIADVGSWASGNLHAIRAITHERKGIKVIALSTFSNRAIIVEAFRCGVQGYVLKQDGIRQIVHRPSTPSWPAGPIFAPRQLKTSWTSARPQPVRGDRLNRP